MSWILDPDIVGCIGYADNGYKETEIVIDDLCHSARQSWLSGILSSRSMTWPIDTHWSSLESDPRLQSERKRAVLLP
jgi:hypothetical protein